ncbi:GNAT family N-acetyltransferase [Nocardia sp. NPDC020380]|uniref:GNAT family N-acetyltransferase n=1 Tax=Nocardia sp. NPDC020380 TaxID=3364309 RepID=UPI00378D3984
MTSPAPRDVWLRVLSADPTATPSQTPTWLDSVCRSDGWHDASRLYRMPDGRTLILPLVRRPLVGASTRGPVPVVQASFPHGWGTGGVLAPGGATAEDIAVVYADLCRNPRLRTMIRPGYAAAYTWARISAEGPRQRFRSTYSVPRSTHVLDLSGGFAQVWSHRFTSKARNGIRNAERKAVAAGIDIRIGNTPDLVADFYRVYLRWLDQRAQQWRSLRPLAALWSSAEPLCRFQTVAAMLGADCRIWVAELDGAPVAANIALFHEYVAVGWRAYGDRAFAGSSRAQELLQCRSIEYACDIGCRTFVMGESGGMNGIRHVKERLGAIEFDGAEYTFQRLPIPRLDGARTALRSRALGLASSVSLPAPVSGRGWRR